MFRLDTLRREMRDVVAVGGWQLNVALHLKMALFS